MADPRARPARRCAAGGLRGQREAAHLRPSSIGSHAVRAIPTGTGSLALRAELEQGGRAGDGIPAGAILLRRQSVERETGFEPATFCLGSPDLVSAVAERERASESPKVMVSRAEAGGPSSLG